MTTVMESFDAQMMDYHNDDDVQMHVSHEIWFQEEAPMEDDGHQLHGDAHSNSTEFEDVEIDMEENNTEGAQNPEYEMVDEDGGADYPVDDVEEDDIIVHDVSHPAEATAGNMSDFYVSTEPLTSSFPSQERDLRQLELPPTSFDSDDVGGNSIDPGDNHYTSPTTHADLPPPESSETPSVEDVGATLATNEFAAASNTDLSEVQVSTELTGTIIQPEQSAEGSDDLPDTSQLETPAVESSQIHAEFAADLDHGDFSGAGSHTLSNEEATVGGFPEEEPEDPFHEDRVDAIPTQHDHNPEAESLQLDDTVGHNDPLSEMTKDSLEFSEEAVLGSPPGVLLSFAHVDHPNVCLFDQPNHPESSSATGQSYKLLFEDNPSLYFEPLSALFEALRQNEYIIGLLDLSLSELVIDAFDLQLMISEDNIFSRETSLYDLHQLHGGSGFSGPLCLRLQSTSPRFIVRYRLLQDQIYRLDLAAHDHEEEYKDSIEQIEGHATVEEQTTISHPETEGTEETYTEELTRVENSGEESEHGYDASFEQQEQDGENENETPNKAPPDAEAAEEPLEDGAETDTRENELDSATEAHEEIDERYQETVDINYLKAETDQVVTTVGTVLVTKDEEREEQTYGEAAHNEDRDDGTESENTSQLNTEELTTENETSEPLPEGLDHSPEDREIYVAHDTNGHVNVNELNYSEHRSDEESYAGYTDDWDDTFEDNGGLDTTFEEGVEEEENTNTLSSKSSKRSIDEVEAEGIDESSLPLDSPGSKRPRVD